MKKKLLFLLGSVFAGACLVGGTFAAYAVTDNANPFGIKITPTDGGSITTAATATLEWGDTASFTDISGLEIGGEDFRTVAVKATTSDSAAYTGVLSLKLTDQTVTPGTDHLYNYLTVEVYDGAKDSTPAPTKITYIPTAESEFTATANVEVTSATAKTLYFYVGLDEDMPISTYQSVKNDIVYLEIDWNKAATDSESTEVYFEDSTGTPTCYAFASGNKKNAEWPGEAMTKVDGYTNLYSYTLATIYDKVIFVKSDGKTQTDDLDVDDDVRTTTPYWNGEAWAAKPVAASTDFYLIGSNNGWANEQASFKFTVNTAVTDEVEYKLENVSFAAGAEFKIITSDGSTFYGEETCGSSSNTNVVTINDAGAYDIYFRPNGTSAWTGFKYIHVSAHSA